MKKAAATIAYALATTYVSVSGYQIIKDRKVGHTISVLLRSKLKPASLTLVDLKNISGSSFQEKVEIPWIEK